MHTFFSIFYNIKYLHIPYINYNFISKYIQPYFELINLWFLLDNQYIAPYIFTHVFST
jgi:hypothetical protein